ncbi:MAG TPA: flagellar biosynthesis anti-sigma factor FlgM [Steroidobacteraceae bacterium]|nr:flagellar biosynthesis anti-sigma factor FlgM [Steroidobacteraceae bacterium]
MPSKISGIDSSPIGSVGAGRAVQRPQDATTGAAASGNSPDDVQITGTARQLADLEQTLRDLPAVNETRVAEIRTALEKGTYTIRPQHVAEQLMSLEKALRQYPSDDSESSNPGNAGK